MQLAFIGGLGTPEMIIILIVALLLFGSRLPKVMRGLGQSINQFKQGMTDVVESTDLDMDGDANTNDEATKPKVEKKIGS